MAKAKVRVVMKDGESYEFDDIDYGYAKRIYDTAVENGEDYIVYGKPGATPFLPVGEIKKIEDLAGPRPSKQQNLFDKLMPGGAYGGPKGGTDG